MRRILPHPLMSVFVFGIWVTLQGSIAPATLTMAALLALVLPQVMRVLEPERPRVRSPLRILQLAGLVLRDVIRSNYAVATIVLGRRRRERVSGFIYIPLDIRSPYALATLAVILTGTPGTLWVQYDAATGRLLLHVLDLVDEADWVRLVKGRYEARLKDIFE
jgi:multicomponent K+:H+ antiporter subunit E